MAVPRLHHGGLSQNAMFFLSPGADFVAAATDPAPGSSPPGAYLLTVWNTVTDQRAIEQPGFGYPLFAFSARGNMIAESSLSGISAIDIEARRELHRYHAVRPFVRSLSFSPDAKWVASGHDDGAVRIWKVDRSRHVGCRRPKRVRHPPVADRLRGGWPDEPEQLTR